MLDDTKVFNAFLEEYMGDVSPSEALRLRYLDLLAQNPGLEEVLDEMPLGVHASRQTGSPGLFTCAIEPIRLVGEGQEGVTWTIDGGAARWALRKADGQVVTDIVSIDEAISCDRHEPGVSVSDRVEVRNLLKKAQDERHAALMKDSGLPLDAPSPLNVCWMELQ